MTYPEPGMLDLRAQRRKCKLTSAALSQLAGYDKGGGHLRHVECGLRPFSPRMAKRLAPHLNCQPEQLTTPATEESLAPKRTRDAKRDAKRDGSAEKREYERKHNQTPARKAAMRLKNHRRRARKRQAGVDNHTVAALSARWLPYCVICLEPLARTDKLHKDHYRPISAGGADVVSNVSMVHAACNLSKNATVPAGPLFEVQGDILAALNREAFHTD